MLFADFLKWWYGAGWVLRFQMLSLHFVSVSEFFSIPTLLRTLFSPWRQNITGTTADQGINQKFSALVDNLVSRLVGFWVRIFMLIAAVTALLVTFVLNWFYIRVWPLVPVSQILILAIGVAI